MSILHKHPPQKQKDPGSFIIPCIIGDKFVGKALCDLGASINLMPKSIFQKLGIGKARPTTVVLQLADRSYVHPEGKIEDILVRVDKFIFPADFLVLDCEVDENAPIILGRPFLATGRSLIDMEKGELTMRVNDQEIKLNVLQAIKHADAEEECKAITEITFDQPCIRSGYHDITIGHCLSSHLEDCHDSTDDSSSSESDTSDTEDQEEVNWIGNRLGKLFEPLNYTSDEHIVQKPSTVEPPVLDLKPLPGQLKYVFLGLNDTLPVIISSKLMQEQEQQLIVMLQQHKKAIGWTIADIQGISPVLCMHKILLEDDHKPTIDAQRRLNDAMREVVRKEIIKWLDAGIIYAISDSKWVIPVQCVPKKGGITVVTNEENELIPTRTVTGWRVCMDYRKLNKATRKDHFPLPFIDQMLDRLAGKPYYCFLDGYSGYNQIAIAPEDQEKTTFTCPYSTYAFRRIPFGLCNAPTSFQMCMMAIFSDMVEDFLEIFINDFSVFGDNFESCLGNLQKVLERCEKANLVLN
ncbi:hypothetical protein HRI_004583500 [Hibiscus trionum]|uniref:Reverse transcriptase domain-containing protein n=1 Tax=Hibiscus trionum TaxID=183268 RepID=A0A9W7MLB8_HIBTR|nr:hypothetical protein HRI_004583500 [Hibiscus trionum]